MKPLSLPVTLTRGFCNSNMTITNVSHIYNSDCKSKHPNYRCVSVLSTVAKIFKNLFLFKFWTISGKTTLRFKKETFKRNFITICYEWMVLKYLQRVPKWCCFFNIMRAFDCVDHSILLRKCELYGIRLTRGWIKLV